MKYEIKNFENKEDQKMIGLWVIDGFGRKLAIDKFLPIVENKTPESYVKDAIVLCEREILDWQSSNEMVGKLWNTETNSFEE